MSTETSLAINRTASPSSNLEELPRIANAYQPGNGEGRSACYELASRQEHLTSARSTTRFDWGERPGSRASLAPMIFEKYGPSAAATTQAAPEHDVCFFQS
jgi:hypothetical protein